jgi:hypothetical protein
MPAYDRAMEDSVERFDRPDADVLGRRRTIVTALPLKPAARRQLSALLDARVIDVREPCDHPDLVLTPACSPQLIDGLKRRYNGARVVVVELDDWDFGIESRGPVKRIIRGGADAYVLADSLEELATKISARSSREDRAEEPAVARELTTNANVDELIAAFLRESIDYSTRRRVAEQ